MHSSTLDSLLVEWILDEKISVSFFIIPQCGFFMFLENIFCSFYTFRKVMERAMRRATENSKRTLLSWRFKKFPYQKFLFICLFFILFFLGFFVNCRSLVLLYNSTKVKYWYYWVTTNMLHANIHVNIFM